MINTETRDGIAVYCKCGRIIWAVTNEGYKRDKKTRDEFDQLFAKGFTVAKVFKKEVQDLFGCSCEKK